MPHLETYQYDANGNLSQVTDRKSQVTTFTYDGLNRRTTTTYPGPSTVTATYDAGNRVTQLADLTAGTITRTYDGLNRLTQETTPQGTVSYTYDAVSRRATMTVAGQPAVTYSYDTADRLTQLVQGSQTVGLAYDDGNRRTSLTNPYQFTGREADGTGLYYYRARYYHPGLERFISEDPIGLATGEFNLYAYARNQPTLLRDPLGLWTAGVSVEFQGGLMGHGAGIGVSLVIDGHGNVGVQVTVGAGGYGGHAGGSVGVEGTGTTAGTIHDLTGPGAAGQISPVPTGIGPTFGGVAGSGYAGGTLGAAFGVGTGVGSGFITNTRCLLGCRKSTPPPDLPPIVAP